MSKSQGEALIDLLVSAGFKCETRGNFACTLVKVEGGSFVVDLTVKPMAFNASDEAKPTTVRPDGQGDSNVG